MLALSFQSFPHPIDFLWLHGNNLYLNLHLSLKDGSPPCGELIAIRMERQLLFDKLKILSTCRRLQLSTRSLPSFDLNYDFCAVILNKKYTLVFCERGVRLCGGGIGKRRKGDRETLERGLMKGRAAAGVFCRVKQMVPVPPFS